MDTNNHTVRNPFAVKDVAIDVTASLLGGVACIGMGQPWDTVKVKLQTFPGMYRGMAHCMFTTWKTGGVTALYAGAMPALVAKLAQNAVLFAAYGSCQRMLANVLRLQSPDQLKPYQNALSGGIAAFFSSLVLTPTELVKCRIQTSRETGSGNLKTGPLNVLVQTVRAEGVRGLFRGLTFTLAREMPGYFFLFFGYEWTRRWLTPANTARHRLGPLETAFCGGMGGLAFWCTMFPVDVAKSRIQVGTAKESLPKVIITIVKQEGVGALYNGLKPMAVRTFVALGPLFLVYEYTKQTLHRVCD